MARLRMGKQILVCLVCAAALLALAPVPVTGHVLAAPAPDPLLDILARVPDSAGSRNMLSYASHRAIEAAYPPARTPASLEQINAVKPESKDDPVLGPVGVWWHVFRNMQSPTAAYFSRAAASPDAMGINYFDIDQEIGYGVPPALALQLAGNFDADSVQKAFGAHGFTRSDQSSDVNLWCGPEGCESGSKLNPAALDPANLFGGNLGRKEPLIIGKGYLIGSASFDFVKEHIAAITGQAHSLADAPEYRAAVKAITQNGTLIQATFVDGKPLLDLSNADQLLADLTRSLGKAALKTLLEEQLKTYQTLPPYQLLALADTATDQEQVGLVALVYANAADAKTAQSAIPPRIDSYFSVVTRSPLKTILAQRYIADVQTQLVDDADTGKTVLLLVFGTPKATPDQLYELVAGNPNPPKVLAPGLIYRLFFQGITSRDIGWLSTVPREALQQQLDALSK